MAEGWNLTTVEPLNDNNYFLWKEKIEGILRAKRLWKKVMGIKPLEKPQAEDEAYEEKYKEWDEWDDNNHAARTIMINTMTKAQVLKYCDEKIADRLWNKIKYNMAAETEQVKARTLSDLTNLRMTREETVDEFINRAEALRNQCTQLGKAMEPYELKMYILRGLRGEFEQNVRILENQRDTSINDIRYALKQEEIRKDKRKDEKMWRDPESVKRMKEKIKNEILCYNCGKRGHTSGECYGKLKCFNCQGIGHIAAECKEMKGARTSRGRGQRGRFQKRNHWKENGQSRGRGETMMRTSDEAVMTMTERIHVNKIAEATKECSEGKESKNVTWLLDSGSTSHMVWDSEMFDKLCNEEREIMLADKGGRKLVSNGIGEVPLRQEDIENRVRLKNVLCVPDLNTNLLSVAKFTDYGYKVTFDQYGAQVYKEPGKIQMKAVRKGNAYYVETIGTNSEAATATLEDDIWHKRLGHVNKRTIEEMKKEELVIGMKDETRMNVQCKGCVEGKACRKVHPRLEIRKTKEIMELWHLDLIGPVHPTSKGGRRYVFTIIDDYARMFFVVLLREKGEAANELKKLIIMKENQTGKRLKSIRSDNGGEFVGNYLRGWLEHKGIKHELSPARTPQCNGVAERGNRSLIEITRSLMSDSQLPMNFWAEAMHLSAHIKNRTKSGVHGKTPYELWHKRRPNIKYMKRFGCIAYLLNKEGLRNKFEPKTLIGIFLGYADNNTYRVYLPKTGKVRSDCDVKFDESKNGVELLKWKRKEEDENYNDLVIIGIEDETKNAEIEINEEREEEVNEDEDSIYEDADTEEARNEDEVEDSDRIEEEQREDQQLIQSRKVGRPKGTTKEVMRMRRQNEREENMIENEGLRRSERLKQKQQAMLIIDEEIPKNVQEAKESGSWKNWKQAMQQEINSIKRHRVWDVVARPREKKIIRSKWVFNIKQDPNTKEKRYKARLVAVGCAQRPGFDFFETFAPVVRTETVRLLFSISAEKKRKVKSYDVKTAFLHGELEEEIYMELPEEYEIDNCVCKLKKSVYGLKQAGRCWNQFLVKVLMKNGLIQSKEDPCLFFKREGKEYLYCGIHVDDMIVVSSCDKFEECCMNEIGKEIEIKNLGEAKSVLGLQIEQDEGKVVVHLKDYILKLLELYGMSECNSVTTPIDVNVKMDDHENSQLCNINEYQELLGRLMYLSVYARPDISYAVTCLSQFNKNPKVMHLNGLKRVLRYLKGTINFNLIYGNGTEMQEIRAETDASWDSTKDAKSFTGLLVYRNGDLVQWRSKKQSTVALSSTESELEAMLEGVKEVIWFNNLLKEIGMGNGVRRMIKCDNLNAVRLANGGNYKSKSKLLNRKCHYVKEAVMRENLCITHVPSERMTADCLTKPISGPNLLRNVRKILQTM